MFASCRRVRLFICMYTQVLFMFIPYFWKFRVSNLIQYLQFYLFFSAPTNAKVFYFYIDGKISIILMNVEQRLKLYVDPSKQVVRLMWPHQSPPRTRRIKTSSVNFSEALLLFFYFFYLSRPKLFTVVIIELPLILILFLTIFYNTNIVSGYIIYHINLQ